MLKILLSCLHQLVTSSIQPKAGPVRLSSSSFPRPVKSSVHFVVGLSTLHLPVCIRHYRIFQPSAGRSLNIVLHYSYQHSMIHVLNCQSSIWLRNVKKITTTVGKLISSEYTVSQSSLSIDVCINSSSS